MGVHRYPFSIVDPHQAYEKKVAVYYNLHYGVYSIKQSVSGKLISHAKTVKLSNCEFYVNIRQRQRAILNGQKNVHAFLLGNLENLSWNSLSSSDIYKYLQDGYSSFTYNLTKEQFYLEGYDYSPLLRAKTAILSDKTRLVSL